MFDSRNAKTASKPNAASVNTIQKEQKLFLACASYIITMYKVPALRPNTCCCCVCIKYIYCS